MKITHSQASWNRIGLVATIMAVLAAVLGLAACGGSSDHSSEWNSEQESQLKAVLAEKAPEFTEQGEDCIVEGVKPLFSPTSDEFSDSDEKKVQDVAKRCAEESSENVQGVLSQACQEEGILSSTCLDEVTASATESVHEELEEYDEGYEPYSY
jgi:hypothetical protein